MKIRSIMSEPAITCRTTDSLQSAARLMWERDCGALPVVDDDGTLTGVLTDRDICMSVFTHGGGDLQAIAASDAMAKEVFSCTGDASLDAIKKLMSQKQIRRVPVVDGSNRPIGMISLNDIVRHAAVAPKKEGRLEAFTRTMAAICEPRSLHEESAAV